MRRTARVAFAITAAVAVGALDAPLTAQSPASEILVIAHRGASAHAPEHTFASWDLAFEADADFIELDLQMTRDGTLVVMHDEELDRTARGPEEFCTGLVRDRTVAEIKHCSAGAWFNDERVDRAQARFADERIPTLAEVFDRYGRRVNYYIETKNPETAPGLEEALLGLLNEHGLIGAPGGVRVIIQSFHPASLLRMRNLEPSLPLVQLVAGRETSATIRPLLAEVAAYAMGIGPQYEDVDAELMTAARAAGLEVHPYTVNETNEMQRLIDLGVTGMFTDEPSRLRELLARR